MPITVTCGGCGKTFNVKDEWAGRAGKCPGCGARITVPGAAFRAQAAPTAPPGPQAPPPYAVPPPPPLPAAAPFCPAAPQPLAGRGNRPAWLVWAIVGGLFSVCAVIVLLLLFNSQHGGVGARQTAKPHASGSPSGLADDADQITRIAADYQDSIRKGVAGGATSVQRERVIQSADREFAAKIKNIKSVTLHLRLRDVIAAYDSRYPNRRRIILQAPERLAFSAARLTVNEIQVDGHQTELMNLKPGDAVCLRGSVAYFKGGGALPLGSTPNYGDARSSCLYWQVYGPDAVLDSHVIFVPRTGSTIQIGATTWNVLDD